MNQYQTYLKIVLATFLVASGLLMGRANADPVTGTYTGEFDRGAGGGVAWSFGHEASKSPVTPSGGFTQYTSGTVPFAVNPFTEFDFEYDDVDLSTTLSDTDTIGFDSIIVPINEYTGGVAGGTLTSIIGSLELSGTLTVGGSHSASYTHGISGDLDFLITFTDDATRGGYLEDDVITGTATFQAAAIAGQFNGIGLVAPGSSDLRFAVWGDNRDGTGAISGTFSRPGEADVDDYAFGLDLVLGAALLGNIELLPEPGSLTLAALGALTMLGFGWRKKRRTFKA